MAEGLDFVREHGANWTKNGAYTIVREYFPPVCNTALGQKMIVLPSVLVGIFPCNAIRRTRLHRFFNTVFGSALRHDHFCFFFFFVKRKNFCAKLNTALTADTFIGVDHNFSGHYTIPLYEFIIGRFAQLKESLR